MRTEIEELFRKLQPVYGERIDKLWQAYIAANDDERKKIEQLLEILSLKALNQTYRKDIITLVPPSATAVHGDYPLGRVIYGDRPLFPVGLREEEWVQHISVFGRSGSGKTNLVFQIIGNLLEKDKPFLVFDWKRNYRDILTKREAADVRLFTVGRNISPFRFNPLIPPPGTNPMTWLKKIIEVIGHAYFTGEGVSHLLQNAIHAAYKEKGVYKGNNQYPVFTDILGQLRSLKTRGRQSQWWDSSLRVLSSLTFGEMGRVVNVHEQMDIASLLTQPVILELDALSNTDKTFLIESLLLWIHHYRLQDGKREEFRHCIIIEEAHHILLKKKMETSVSGEAITDVILREIRELCESIVLIDQHPSLISLPALGNSNTTICFNLKHQLDVMTAGSSMLLNREEQEYLGLLKVGQAVAKFQNRGVKPFLIHVPLAPVRKGSVTDAMIRARSGRFSADSGIKQSPIQESETFQECHSQDTKEKTNRRTPETQLIMDVIEYPFSSVSERFRRLGLSNRQGYHALHKSIQKKYLRIVEVSTRRAKVKLLEPTPLLRDMLAPRLRDTTKAYQVFSRSAEHEYFKSVVARYYRKTGCIVEIEKKMNGAFADLFINDKEKQFVVEIETGKSDFMRNIHSALKLKYPVITVPTSPEAEAAIRKKIKDSGLETHEFVTLIPAQQFFIR